MKTDELKAAFRNARYLLLPFLLPDVESRSSSATTGALPGTDPWCALFPRAATESLDMHWRRFRSNHNAARERAKIFRALIQNEGASIKNRGEVYPISLRRPEIELVGCIGASLEGYGIRYMDVIAIYPAKQEVEVNCIGEGEQDTEGNRLFKEFELGIGDGIVLGSGSLAKLKYHSDLTSAALKGCPDDLKDWVGGLQKVRRIDALKKLLSGEYVLEVSSYRGGPEKGIDHPITNITGRVFAHYGRDRYEARLRACGLWNRLSDRSRLTELLGPEVCWDDIFFAFTPEDRTAVERFLLGEFESKDVDQKLIERLYSLQETIRPTPILLDHHRLGVA